MAKEKDKNNYRQLKNPELLNEKKDTQQERLERGSKGNPSKNDWQGFIKKQKDRDASDRANLDSKVTQRKQELEKENNQSKEQHKNKQHGKER